MESMVITTHQSLLLVIHISTITANLDFQRSEFALSLNFICVGPLPDLSHNTNLEYFDAPDNKRSGMQP